MIAAPQQQKAWSPNPGPQTLYFLIDAFELMYGGAAGGGKSTALLFDAVRDIGKAGYRAILFRRKFPELQRSLIAKSHEWYPGLGGRYNSQSHTWTFRTPDGGQSHIEFAHLEREETVHNYQSAEYQFIGFDELTSFTEFQYTYMISRLRGGPAGVRHRVRSATNPGNIGHVWVKRRFVTPTKGGTVIYQDPVTGLTRAYVRALVTDNAALMASDPAYMIRLELLPEKHRKALKDGDWNAVEGQAFAEFDEARHVCDPFPIPPTWRLWLAHDWGYHAPTCWLWVAQDPDTRRRYIYRELYQTRLLDEDQARMVTSRTPEAEWGRLSYCAADPSIWTKRTQYRAPTSTADTYQRIWAETDGWSLPLVPANNDRVGGKRRFHSALDNLGDGSPGLVIFKTCENLIRTLPQLIVDDKNPDDVDTDGEDHAYDAARYSEMSAGLSTPQMWI